MYDLSVLNLAPQYEIVVAEPIRSETEILAIPLVQLIKGADGADAFVTADFVEIYQQAKTTAAT